MRQARGKRPSGAEINIVIIVFFWMIPHGTGYFFLYNLAFMRCICRHGKKLSNVENTFVFLFVLVISINFSWIVIEEFGWMQLTKNGMEYTAYLLNRSIITPIIFLIQLNLIYKLRSTIKKSITVIMTIVILAGLNLLSSYWHITTYKKWNVGLELVYFVVLTFIVYFIYKGFHKISYSGAKKNDSL